MKTYDEYERMALPDPAFSCHADLECWQFSVCSGGGVSGRRCVNDDSIEDGGGCPLLVLAVCGQKTPQEWLEAKGKVAYRCTEKTTPAEARRVEQAAEEEAERAALRAEHYLMFPLEVPQ